MFLYCPSAGSDGERAAGAVTDSSGAPDRDNTVELPCPAAIDRPILYASTGDFKRNLAPRHAFHQPDASTLYRPRNIRTRTPSRRSS